jgi:hypothetical protein
VVAGPSTAHGLVEDALAGADVQGRAVGAAADEDVVDPGRFRSLWLPNPGAATKKNLSVLNPAFLMRRATVTR